VGCTVLVFGLVVREAGVDVGGPGDVGGCCICVLCLGNGVLDEAGRGGFVDCELAFGRIFCILNFIKVLSYSVLRGDRNVTN